MVISKRFSLGFWVLTMFGFGLVAASCTNILGIDTEHTDNICSNGAALPPLDCGFGACQELIPACDANGLPVLECPPVTKTNDTDTCGDGIDNDCDGLVDENDIDTCVCTENQLKNCFSGAPGNREQGLCRDGYQSCDQGTWGKCDGDVLPEPEVADGRDNNCDGSIDEGLPCADGEKLECYGGSTDTLGKGPCKAGEQLCKNGKWGECVGQQLPAALDPCNGFDDDCDGEVDNISQAGTLCECATGDSKACYVNEAGEKIECPLDLQGECKCGSMTCGANQQFGPCVGAIKPTTDICDFLDNDCNGVVDNIGLPNSPCLCAQGETEPCYTGPAGSEGVGPCKPGQRACVNGKFGACLGEIVPKGTDACDGQVDDDCNGVIDNIGLPGSPCICTNNSTEICFTGPPEKLNVGACKAGQRACTNGNWGLCSGQTLPGVELCDGLDNDCNGGVDDGIPGVGDSCFLSEYANTPCYQGKIECPLGKTQPECVPSTKPGFIPEKCDGVDNNCNLLVDDGFFCCPNDGKISGNETDLDCGGSCPLKCNDNQGCIVGIDCKSGNCFQNQCKSATCGDGLKNGLEADVDCGEVCPNKCIVGKSCVGDNDCISNLCQPASKTCIQKSKGSSCLADAECSSGYCVDNVCCSSSCGSECQACTAAKKGSGLDGDCGAIAGSTDPDNECQIQSPDTCGNTGMCSGSASCAKYSLGTQCAPASCTNASTENPADTCDGQGSCVQKFDKACQTGYSCVGSACKTTCVSNGECANGYFCNAPTCQIKKTDGDSCINGAQCASGNCVDGVCCNTICSDTCKACNIPGSLGTCSPIAANNDPVNECNPGSCDGLGQCQKNNGASCGTTDQCVSGNCVDGVCCNTSCLGTCVSCANAGSVGNCTNIPSNTDPAAECFPGECDGMGKCQGVVSTVCIQPSDCASGFCVDGYCCDTVCSGTCEACAASLKGSGADGTCGPIAVNLDPNNECNPGACNGAKACQLGNGNACMTGSQCATGNCVDGVCCNQACGGTCQACNVQNNVGTCVAVPANQDPANECNPGACDGLAQCQVALGSGCSTANQCTSGFCVDGVCCDSICSGLCQACTTALKGTGNNGECGSVVSGQDPQNECDQEPASTCGKTGTCNGVGACSVYTNGTVCNSATCSGNTQVNADTCNGAGVCQDGGTMNCGSYSCNAGVCLGSCNSDVQCAGGSYCNTLNNTCVIKLAQGSLCTGNNQCALGFCVDGVCCDSGCTAECKSCAVAGSVGTCTNVPSGQTDNSPSCQGVQLCNGSGKCVDTNGQPCSTNTECFSQACVDLVCCENGCLGTCYACTNTKTNQPNGTCAPIASNTDPENECVGSTVCNGVGACGKLADGAICASSAECNSNFCVDGVCCENACSGACKACSASKTGGANGLCGNIDTDTDPDNECVTECNGAGACEAANGSACMLGSQCQSGSCADGVCCNNACSGDCQTCNKAGSIGTCSPITSGQDTCLVGSVCDATGTCKALQGEVCATNGACLSGFCVDNVCCSTACGSTCQACSAAKTGGTNGTCGNITTNTDPDNECVGANVCKVGACVKVNGDSCGVGGECLSGNCIDNVCCDTTCGGTCQACNVAGSLGTCSNVPPNTDPANECSGSGVCNGAGACVKGQGDICGMAGECATGFCIDGVCCESACPGTCKACSAAKTGGVNGTCGFVSANTDLDNECSPGECDGTGACELPIGSICTLNAQCQSAFCADGFCCNTDCNGTCVSCNQMMKQGTCTDVPVDTDPANECNPGDCNGSGACELADGAACTLDSQCGNNHCVDGVCCATDCTGTCNSCSNALTGVASGTCAPTLAGQETMDECVGPSFACDGLGFCQVDLGAGCTSSAQCGSGVCIDNVCCDAACNGLCEACTFAKTGAPDGQCNPVSVGLEDANECPGTPACNGAGACQQANGTGPCAINDQCESGSSCAVADNVCCNSACGGSCQACTFAKTGVTNGTCAPIPSNADPDTECTVGVAQCTGFGACEVADGMPCPNGNADCQSGYCFGGTCATPSCTDGIKNGTETDRDCGGTCSACALLFFGGDNNRTLTGSFPVDNASPTWTFTASVGARSDVPVALTMPTPALGVAILRDTQASNKLRYLTWAGATGTWSAVADVTTTVPLPGGSAALSLSSIPGSALAAYREDTTKKLFYAKFDGTTWSPVNDLAHTLASTSAASAMVPAIAGLPSGEAFMTYNEVNGANHEVTIRSRVAAWAGPVVLSGTAVTTVTPKVVALTNGELLVAYVSSGVAVSVRRRDIAGMWQAPAALTGGNLVASTGMSLAALPNGGAIIAFEDSSNNRPRYAIFNGTNKTWGAVADVSTANVGTSIAVTRGMAGKVAELVYVDNGTGNANHTRFDGSTWSAPVSIGSSNSEDVTSVSIAAPLP